MTKKKMTSTLLEGIIEFKDKIAKEVEAIAEKRDALRLLTAELESTLDSIENADHDFRCGIGALEDGINEISQYL